MMLKVKVGDEVGYIDCNSIIAPSKDIDFLITNANIKKDGTYVYTSADSNSVVKDVLKKDKEAVLKLTLQKGETSLYYYTRIAKDNEYHVKECLDYVQELHTNMLKKENEDAVKKVMEANASGDNTTLQHVTIHSDLKHSMWGDLKPEIVGDLQYEIKESKAAYTSVQLNYQV